MRTPPPIPPELQERPEDRPKPPPPRPQGTMQQLMSVSVVGTNFAFTVGAAAIIGYFLDRWLGTSPWLLISLAGVGLISGVARLIREAKPLLDPKAGPPKR